MSINSSHWTGFWSIFLSSYSCLTNSCGVKNCVTWDIKISFLSSRLPIKESTGAPAFVRKFFILMLLLLDFGEDFWNVFGKWLSEMVSFSFNFKVLPSGESCFSKCFCSLFCGSCLLLLSKI